jgi:hypothetical protein
MKIRTYTDGTTDGECCECGNVCQLFFKRGRWLCEFCRESDFMVAEFAREDRCHLSALLVVGLLLLTAFFLR